MIDIIGEGEQDVMCPECEHKFIVEVMVSYEFVSPPLKGETDG